MTLFRIIARLDGLDREYQVAANELRREIFLRLSRIGEMYVSMARSDSRAYKVYTDRTANLRTAHSYAVYEDGVAIYESIGRPETQQMFERMKEGTGIELLVGNGMNYASFVEGKGFDVSTAGFMKVESEIRRLASTWQV
ncbi:MAG: hypothetical protein LBS55_06495 [Prevotellaceae bacterium]|jgi:hypothetical protein|nr:hypothetical protein [Prevotellaceae bacterium]